jgi:hypothetical protein
LITQCIHLFLFAKNQSLNQTSNLLKRWWSGAHKKSQIANNVVSYYSNLFCTNFVLQEQMLAEEVIPNFITDEVNPMLTDGCGAFFYQTTGT